LTNKNHPKNSGSSNNPKPQLTKLMRNSPNFLEKKKQTSNHTTTNLYYDLFRFEQEFSESMGHCSRMRLKIHKKPTKNQQFTLHSTEMGETNQEKQNLGQKR